MDTGQQRSTTIARKFTGFLSMIGAGYVIYEVLFDKKKQKKPYFRLLLGMMLVELSDGLAFFLGSWCVPAGTWWGAVGNRQTCLFQGFLLQLSIGSALYNAGLAFYYLLSIRYSWTERMFQQKVEPWIHIISLGFALCVAIAAYFLDLYASIGSVCYINRYPYDCKETYKYGHTTCEQGNNATLYVIIFFQIPLWFSVFSTASCMIMVWLSVRHQETRNARYVFAGIINNNQLLQQPNRKHSRKFAKQGVLYVIVFFLCHIFSSTNIILTQVSGQSSYLLYLLAGIFIPLEGFLNCLVYLRPRFLQYLKKRRKKNIRQENNQTLAVGSGENVPQDIGDTENEKLASDMEVPSNNGNLQNNYDDGNLERIGLQLQRSLQEIKLEEEEDVLLGAY